MSAGDTVLNSDEFEILKFGVELLGYVGLVFGMGMTYQRIIDRLKLQDDKHKELRNEFRSMRRNLMRITEHLAIGYRDDGDGRELH